jgi:hypothetical protein
MPVSPAYAGSLVWNDREWFPIGGALVHRVKWGRGRYFVHPEAFSGWKKFIKNPLIHRCEALVWRKSRLPVSYPSIHPSIKFWHFSCHLKVSFIHFTFKNSVEFTQKKFFKSDNSYTKAHCFYTYVKKRQGSVIKKSVQGESSWSMFWCISVSIQNKRYLGSFGLEIKTYFN